MLLFCVSAAYETSPAVVVRLYAGAPYGELVYDVSAHLFPVPHTDRRRLALSGSDARRFRLTDGGALLTVGEHPALTGQTGDEYVVSVTSLVETTTGVAAPRTLLQVRVLVSRENLSPPRFVTDGSYFDGSYSADARRDDVAGTLVRMRRTISLSDDDIDDYNRAVTFALIHRRRRRSPAHESPYLSIDPVSGQLTIGRVLCAVPGNIIRTSIVATNAIASPRLSSSVEVTVYICDTTGKSCTTDGRVCMGPGSCSAFATTMNQ